MRDVSRPTADGNGLVNASCTDDEGVGGDNATKGTCKSNNENQHEIYSSQIPETRRSSSLINARLTWWNLEVKGAWSKVHACMAETSHLGYSGQVLSGRSRPDLGKNAGYISDPSVCNPMTKA